MKKVDFLAIGDTTIDNFIKIKDAHINCGLNKDNCELCVKFGQKVPYESFLEIPAVGNSANAVVCASRLGLKSAIVTTVGKDKNGKACLKTFKKENVSRKFIQIDKKNRATNYHFILSYGGERTILVNHNDFEYSLPKKEIGVSWVYLSSIGEHAKSFYQEIINWLDKNPKTKLAFQPGTFQIKLGYEFLKNIYKRSEIFFCNKEEAKAILKTEENDIKKLLEGIKNLGPKKVVITDGKNGLGAVEEDNFYFLPMFPNQKPVVDLTGAGDATSATTTAMLCLGMNLEGSLKYGLVNAMSVISEIGAQKGLLTKPQIEEYLKN